MIIFFYLGGDANGINHGEILRFDKATLEWQEVGSMNKTRYFHAMSVVNVEDVKDYCVQ